MKRTGAQQQAIESNARRICVAAGAGSGKTRVLVERIMRLLRQEVGLEQVVAITFTEKAAAELSERLRAAFREAAAGGDPQTVNYWRALERRLPAARITTIHGFCARILREHALAAGIDPAFTMLDATQGLLLRQRTVREALETRLDAEDPAFTTLAVEFGIDTLHEILVRLLAERGATEAAFARLPDTDDSVEHWRDGLGSIAIDAHRARLGRLPGSVTVARYRADLRRFDDTCSKDTDKRVVLHRAYHEMLNAIDSAEGPIAVERALESVAGLSAQGTRAKNWTLSPEGLEALKDIHQQIKTWVAGLVLPEANPTVELRAAEYTRALAQAFTQCADVYTAAKDALPALDFDDLILRTEALLRDQPAVRARVAQGIAHLLIDEFQDTDGVQLALAELLAEARPGPSLFIVGDAKQSIYGFRGAEVQVFGEAQARAERAGGAVIPMRQNFRTRAHVLAFINALFGESHLLDAVERPYAGLDPFRAAADDAPAVEVLLPPAIEDGNVEDYRTAEAELLATHLRRLVDDPQQTIEDPETGQPRPIRYADIALLFRTTTHLGIYEEALRRAGVSHHVGAGATFYRQQEVCDLANLLRVVADPWDEAALFATLRAPCIALRDDSLLLLAQEGLARTFNARRRLADFPEPEVLARAHTLLDELREYRHAPLPELVRRALDMSGLEAIALAQHHGLRRAANLRKTLDAAHTLAAGGGGLRTLIDYLETVRVHEVREPEAPLQPAGDGAVMLMTVHGAKGLEYPVVGLVDITAGTGSGNRSKHPFAMRRGLGIVLCGSDEKGDRDTPQLKAVLQTLVKEAEAEESARLLYVALTRARDRIILSGSTESRQYAASWLGTIDKTFGDVFQGEATAFGREGWSGRILRTAVQGGGYAGAAASEAPVDHEALRRRIAPVTAVAARQRIVSVSALLDAIAGGVLVGAPSHSASAAEARRRGTMVHAVFEHWSPGIAVEALAERVAHACALNPGEQTALAQSLPELLARFAASPWPARLAAAGTRREVPFLIPLGESLLNGTLDVLFADGTVLDYKTGTPNSLERYELQLRLYAAAVRRLVGTLPPACALYFCDTGETHPVAFDAGQLDETLAAAIRALAATPPDSEAVNVGDQ